MILVLKEWKKLDPESPEETEVVRIIKGDFKYVDCIITQNQIDNLKRHGNTVLDPVVYEKLGHKQCEKELKRLTGFKCYIRTTKDDYVIVETEKLIGPNRPSRKGKKVCK